MSGMNTAQVVSTELSMAPDTSPVPFITASRSGSPLCQRAVMLSVSTIVLSTIMPTPSSRPEREMMLTVIPSRKNTKNDITSDTGIDSDTSSGERRSFMNRNIIAQSSSIAMMILRIRLFIE